jgi:hypothetical protein
MFALLGWGVIRCTVIHRVSRFLGIDLAWRDGNDSLLANETGVAAID